jgi:hypothetical protein
MVFLVLLQMAPKNQQGTKRKTTASSSGVINRPAPLPRNPDRTRYTSNKTYARFLELKREKTWHDKIFRIDPEGEFGDIAAVFRERQWEKLLNPHPKINLDLLCEFYANSMPDCAANQMHAAYSYTTVVRGTTIHFDRDAINEYLGNPYTLPESEDPDEEALCPYGDRQKSGDWDHGKIQREILLPGRLYRPSKKGNPNLAGFTDMKPKAGIIFKFLVHNVWPKSHVTTATKQVTPLIYHICKGRPVDVAGIISRELKNIALGGTAGAETRLCFPGFIMGLLRHKGVQIPDFSEELVSPIDDKYIRSYISRALSKGAASSSQAPPPEDVPPPEDFPEHDDPHQTMPPPQ